MHRHTHTARDTVTYKLTQIWYIWQQWPMTLSFLGCEDYFCVLPVLDYTFPLFPMSSIGESSLSGSSSPPCSRIPALPPAFPFFSLLFFRHGMVVQCHGWRQGGHYSWRSSYSLGMFKTLVKWWNVGKLQSTLTCIRASTCDAQSGSLLIEICIHL